jgi:hypothetical protein
MAEEEVQMHTPQEDEIRARAYALWQREGSPEGRHEEFWHQAQRELSEEADLDTSKANAEVDRPPLQAGLPIH